MGPNIVQGPLGSNASRLDPHRSPAATECISSASVQPCRADPSPREEISKASTDQIGTRGWTNPPLELQARAELLPRWAAAPAEGAEGHRKLHRSVDRHEHRRDQASGRNI
eukprot:CAMPEP_0115098958 /NCGR_PEP_ID=MMETSP0227-20121206/31526_1 /TAXON_ID=89957 /ORGANISM="Polarella glacialis, Strain CCMP 1383" /LENGTH=110 /DNA_ID=CAMNT_0002493777 /DNA_START=709 /DNA_END=1041 /DNA_ORIENTATION=+